MFIQYPGEFAVRAAVSPVLEFVSPSGLFSGPSRAPSLFKIDTYIIKYFKRIKDLRPAPFEQDSIKGVGASSSTYLAKACKLLKRIVNVEDVETRIFPHSADAHHVTDFYFYLVEFTGSSLQNRTATFEIPKKANLGFPHRQPKMGCPISRCGDCGEEISCTKVICDRSSVHPKDVTPHLADVVSFDPIKSEQSLY